MHFCHVLAAAARTKYIAYKWRRETIDQVQTTGPLEVFLIEVFDTEGVSGATAAQTWCISGNKSLIYTG